MYVSIDQINSTRSNIGFTEAVCAILISVPAYAAVVIIVIATGLPAQDAWFPLSVVTTILMISLNYVSK